MKQTILAGVSGLLIVAMCSQGHAESLKTNVWLDACIANPKRTETANEIAKSWCRAYTVGFFDGLVLSEPISICMPEEKSLIIRSKEILEIAIEYAQKHPDEASRPAAATLRNAFEKAFPLPCRQM